MKFKKLLLVVLVAALLVIPLSLSKPQVVADAATYKQCGWTIRDGWGRSMGKAYIQSSVDWVGGKTRFTYATGWVADVGPGKLSFRSFSYPRYTWRTVNTAKLVVNAVSYATFWPYTYYKFNFKLKSDGRIPGKVKCSYSITRIR